MKLFVSALIAGIAYAICTQVLGVPATVTIGATIGGAIVGYIFS